MRVLNERGYRTRAGAKFSDTTIARLIQDPTAKRQFRVNFTKASSKRGWVEFKPESEWVVHEVPPIVSTELWEQCNAILDARKRSRKTVGRTSVHLFSGLTYCECGPKMYVPSRSPKYTCWTCKNRIPGNDLEAIYHEQLKGFLFSDEQVAEQLELADTMLGEKQEALRHLERERHVVQREMDQTYKLYLDGGLGRLWRPLSAA